MLIKSTFPAFSVSSLFLVKRKNVQLYRAFLVCYNRDTESQRAKAAYPPYGGANPPDERKEGDANVYYISGSYPDRYIHCQSHWIVLCDLWDKEIAATTANSDGCYIVTR